jgi:hypothetical protein
MIFLKTLKHQLLSKKEFSRFLLYALGEMILLVIGILLAVEINNWNENRKTRSAEQQLVKGLKAEMVANQKELKEVLTYHKSAADAAYKLMKIYEGDYRSLKSSELDSLFAEVQMTWSFDPRLTILNSIKTGGAINTIQNPKLRAFISNFEELAKDGAEETSIVRSLIINRYVPTVDRYISLNNRSKYIGYEKINSKFASDYAGIFNDRAAESLLAYIHMWKLTEISEAQDLLEILEESIQIAEGEIDQ